MMIVCGHFTVILEDGTPVEIPIFCLTRIPYFDLDPNPLHKHILQELLVNPKSPVDLTRLVVAQNGEQLNRTALAQVQFLGLVMSNASLLGNQDYAHQLGSVAADLGNQISKEHGPGVNLKWQGGQIG